MTLDQNTMVTLDKNTTDAEWKTKLTDFEFKVLRQKGTERPGTGVFTQCGPDGGWCTAMLQVLRPAVRVR